MNEDVKMEEIYMDNGSNMGLRASVMPDNLRPIRGIVTTLDEASMRIISLEIEMRDLMDRVEKLETK